MVFPEEYRQFLRLCGAALVPGAQIYGLVEPSRNDPPLWIDVRTVTELLRGWCQAGTEEPGYLPISDDGMGVYFYLDTTAAPNVEIWGIGPGVRTRISGGLYEFALKLTKGQLIL